MGAPPPGSAPRGGGGGGTSIMYIGYVPRKRPTFLTLNFSSRAYHFHKWRKCFAPEHHHFAFLPLRRPSFSKFLYIQARSSPAHGLLSAASLNKKHSGSAPGLAAGQSTSQTRQTKVSSGDPNFHARDRPGTPHFHARAHSRAPNFHLTVAHIYQNVGWDPPLRKIIIRLLPFHRSSFRMQKMQEQRG